jgi:hypothetical protein
MGTASSPAERRAIGWWRGRYNVPCYGAIRFSSTKGVSTAKGRHNHSYDCSLNAGIFLPILASYWQNNIIIYPSTSRKLAQWRNIWEHSEGSRFMSRTEQLLPPFSNLSDNTLKWKTTPYSRRYTFYTPGSRNRSITVADDTIIF